MVDEKLLEGRVMEIASKYINEDVAPEKIRIETDLGELGITSVKFTHLLIAFEAEFGFETEDEKLHIRNYGNLKDLSAYIKMKINNSDGFLGEKGV